MFKLNKRSLILFCLSSASLVFFSCSDDPASSNPPPSSGGYPDVNIKVGSAYTFTLDSLPVSGGNQRTSIKTTNFFADSGNYFGQNGAFRILSTSVDTSNNVTISRDTFYVRYDRNTGRYYQYGITRILDTNQSPNWDLIADFSVSSGTQWQIASFTSIINGIPVDVLVKGKVAADTTFNTTSGTPQPVRCYRIEITAAVSSFGIPLGTIYVDYFLGYSPGTGVNPSGPVRLRLRPFTIIRPVTGFDQILQTFSIP